MQYRLDTASLSEEDEVTNNIDCEDPAEEVCHDLTKEMEEIRGLRMKIRSMEAELEQRLKVLRLKADEEEAEATRPQIVNFINAIEGKIVQAFGVSKDYTYKESQTKFEIKITWFKIVFGWCSIKD